MNKKGSIFIISGPSGSGKDTVLSGVFKKCPDMEFSISCTTRNMRAGEKADEKYHFISKDEFDGMLSRDELLEHNIFVNSCYGAPRLPVERCVNSGKDILIEVDVNGAAQIRKKAPDAISVFIMPPSLEALKARLSGRGTESAQAVHDRLSAALGEIARAGEYDYIIVNDVLEKAVDDFVAVIKSEGIRAEKQEYLINKILNG